LFSLYSNASSGAVFSNRRSAVATLSIGPGPAWRDITPLLVGIAAVAIRPPRVAADAVE